MANKSLQQTAAQKSVPYMRFLAGRLLNLGIEGPMYAFNFDCREVQ
jgi:hypothetical protein